MTGYLPILLGSLLIAAVLSFLLGLWVTSVGWKHAMLSFAFGCSMGAVAVTGSILILIGISIGTGNWP